MKISIAMASYNGSNYIQEQLDSFRTQTLLPDEVVICDDGSTDNTVNILNDFAREAPFEVKVVRNSERLGYARNFEKAIALCSGEIVFLCDQDDVWFEKKIEIIIEELKKNEQILLIVNDAELTDTNLSSIGLTVTGQLESAGLPREHIFNGCCMAFRSVLKPLILPIPHQMNGHDGWINTLAVSLGCRQYLPIVLQFYRRHDKNASSGISSSTKLASKWRFFNKMIKLGIVKSDPRKASEIRIEQLQILKSRLSEYKIYLQTKFPYKVQLESVMQKISAEYNANVTRYSYQQKSFWKRLIGVIKFYYKGGYEQFEGWKSLVKDIVRPD